MYQINPILLTFESYKHQNNAKEKMLVSRSPVENVDTCAVVAIATFLPQGDLFGGQAESFFITNHEKPVH